MNTKIITYEQALSKAMAICSQQEKCCFDIKEKLKKLGLDNEKIEKIITQLKEEKFIDEERYVKAFTNDKFKFNKWGKQKIKFTLFQKGISEETICNTLNAIDKKEYEQTLLRELEKKKKTLKGDDELKNKEKLIRFAVSKGFEMENIFHVINSSDSLTGD